MIRRLAVATLVLAGCSADSGDAVVFDDNAVLDSFEGRRVYSFDCGDAVATSSRGNTPNCDLAIYVAATFGDGNDQSTALVARILDEDGLVLDKSRLVPARPSTTLAALDILSTHYRLELSAEGGEVSHVKFQGFIGQTTYAVPGHEDCGEDLCVYSRRTSRFARIGFSYFTRPHCEGEEFVTGVENFATWDGERIVGTRPRHGRALSTLHYPLRGGVAVCDATDEEYSDFHRVYDVVDRE